MKTESDSLRLRPFQAVIFDMDGTILDTESLFRTIAFEICSDLGFELNDVVYSAMVGSSHERTNQLLIEAFGAAFPYPMFDERCRVTMNARAHGGVPVKPGARELLGELHGRKIPLAVATSSRSPHAQTHLAAVGLLDLFDTIVTRDDVVNAKPHPEPFLLAATRLGVDPRHCLALEDSPTGVQAAHAAGMQTIMVPDLVHPSPAIRALNIAIVASLDHVRQAAFPSP